MCDEWMPTIKLPLSKEQFQQLPRNPAYKYEYLDGLAYLSPRARHYHAALDLSARPAEDPAVLSTPINGFGEGDSSLLARDYPGWTRCLQFSITRLASITRFCESNAS